MHREVFEALTEKKTKSNHCQKKVVTYKSRVKDAEGEPKRWEDCSYFPQNVCHQRIIWGVFEISREIFLFR